MSVQGRPLGTLILSASLTSPSLPFASTFRELALAPVSGLHREASDHTTTHKYHYVQ